MTAWLRSALFNAFFFGFSASYAALLLPLTTEAMWRGLTGGRSVHLTDWPAADELPRDQELVDAMDRIREVCSTTSTPIAESCPPSSAARCTCWIVGVR